MSNENEPTANKEEQPVLDFQIALMQWHPDPIERVLDRARQLRDAALAQCIDWDAEPQSDEEAKALIDKSKAWAASVDQLYGRVFLYPGRPDDGKDKASDWHALTSGGVIGEFGAERFSTLWAAVTGADLHPLASYFRGKQFQPAALLLGQLPDTLLTGCGAWAFDLIENPVWLARYLEGIPSYGDKDFYKHAPAFHQWVEDNAGKFKQAVEEFKLHPASHWGAISETILLAYKCVRSRALKLAQWVEQAVNDFNNALYPTISVLGRAKNSRRNVEVELAGEVTKLTLKDHECEFLFGLRENESYTFDKTKLKALRESVPGLAGLIKATGESVPASFWQRHVHAHKGSNSVMYRIDPEMKLRIHGERLSAEKKRK